MGLRVAVTGAAGSIGSKLVERLAASDDVEAVLAFDARRITLEHPRLAAFRQDIRHPMADTLREHGIGAVAHLAYRLRTGRDAESARSVNVDGTAQVLRGCQAAGVRQLLYLSSTTVYGPHAGDPQPYTEESPVRPVRGVHYAEQKALTEQMLKVFAADHPDTSVTVLRCCPVVGPRSDNYATRALRRLTLVRVRGADPQMQFIHEDDLQDALERCLLRPVPGVFNVAGEGTLAFSEMVRVARSRSLALPESLLRMLLQVSWALRLQDYGPASGLAMVRWPWIATGAKLARRTGFRPRYTSREALKQSFPGRGRAGREA